MVRWASYAVTLYWDAVVRMQTGSVRTPEFGGLCSDIQYKQWNRPAIPRKYLAEPKTSKSAGGNATGGATGNNAGQAPTTKKKVPPDSNGPDRLRNTAFKEELRQIGFRVGKVAMFLQKNTPPGKERATPPAMESEATFCLNWHKRGTAGAIVPTRSPMQHPQTEMSQP
jgi:hypothetical protein